MTTTMQKLGNSQEFRIPKMVLDSGNRSKNEQTIIIVDNGKLVIEKDRIFTENGNKPYIHGNINPEMNTPYPKNPTIARFFKEIGLADELGSGVRKITQYAEAYAGNQLGLRRRNEEINIVFCHICHHSDSVLCGCNRV